MAPRNEAKILSDAGDVLVAVLTAIHTDHRESKASGQRETKLFTQCWESLSPAEQHMAMFMIGDILLLTDAGMGGSFERLIDVVRERFPMV